MKTEYKTRPKRVNAMRWSHGARHACREFIGEGNYDAEMGHPNVITPYRIEPISEGEWVVKHADGTFEVMTHRAFTQTYVQRGSYIKRQIALTVKPRDGSPEFIIYRKDRKAVAETLNVTPSMVTAMLTTGVNANAAAGKVSASWVSGSSEV